MDEFKKSATDEGQREISANDEGRRENNAPDAGQRRNGGSAEDRRENDEVEHDSKAIRQKQLVAEDARKSDKPFGKKWGMIVGSFLIGALLASGITYLLVGAKDNVVAVVNGEKISQDEFVEVVVAGGAAQALDQLITEKLIQQKAKQENITVSDEEYDEKMAQIKEQFPTEETFAQTLAQEGLTEEEFREQMTETLLLEKMLAPDLEVTDEEVRQFFDENKEMFGEPEKVRGKRIIVSSEEEAKQAHRRLVKGEDFAKVAEDVSVDQETKDNGGDMEMAKGQLAEIDPDLEENIFALKKGELSQPLESMRGYYIVRVDNKIDAKEGQFNDEVAEQITDQLKQQKMQEIIPEWLETLRNEADIDNKLVPENADQTMPG